LAETEDTLIHCQASMLSGREEPAASIKAQPLLCRLTLRAAASAEGNEPTKWSLSHNSQLMVSSVAALMVSVPAGMAVAYIQTSVRYALGISSCHLMPAARLFTIGFP
jgi:hypothetical protein